MELIPGKRYRVTLIATVDPDGTIDADWGVLSVQSFEEDPHITAELLPDSLPTAPGSVVRDPSGDVYQLQPAGHWTSPGELTTYSGDYMSGFAEHLTVLFDAGAER